MKVTELMSGEPAICHPFETANRAAQLMWENDCGIVPVVDASNHFLGVITDRDVCMGSYIRGTPLSGLRVSDSMSERAFACRPDDSLEDALEEMGAHRVRRLPVVDEDAHVVAILSLSDIVRHVAELPEGREQKKLTKCLLGTLGSVCEPRRALPLVPQRPRSEPPPRKKRTPSVA